MTETTEPAWLTIARSHLGVREYTPQRPGPNGELSNPIVEAWQRLAGIRRPDDDVPWCAAFVTGCMHEAGLTSFATSAARAWGSYGRRLEAPRVGAITVLWRESPTSPHGHVAFCVGEDARGMLLLGGNQANAVVVRPYPRARLLGFRWPTAAQLAAAGLDGDGLRLA